MACVISVTRAPVFSGRCVASDRHNELRNTQLVTNARSPSHRRDLRDAARAQDASCSPPLTARTSSSPLTALPAGRQFDEASASLRALGDGWYSAPRTPKLVPGSGQGGASSAFRSHSAPGGAAGRGEGLRCQQQPELAVVVVPQQRTVSSFFSPQLKRGTHADLDEGALGARGLAIPAIAQQSTSPSAFSPQACNTPALTWMNVPSGSFDCP